MSCSAATGMTPSPEVEMSLENFFRSCLRKPVRLTILAKGLLLILVPLLFQLVLIGLVTLTESRERDAARWFEHTKAVLQRAERVLARLMDAETGSRGYILTNDPAFDDPYERATQELPQDLDV